MCYKDQLVAVIFNKMDVLSDKTSRINLLKDRGVSNRKIKHSASIFDSILILFTGCTSWCYPSADLTLPALTVNFQEASRLTDLSDMIINQASKIIHIILNQLIRQLKCIIIKYNPFSFTVHILMINNIIKVLRKIFRVYFFIFILVFYRTCMNNKIDR